jgi:putative redox protein
MDVYFPGGQRVDVLHEGFWIRTDQPVALGGEGSGPSPLDLFVASIATCAGFYALRFCQQRNLDERGLALSAVPERSTDGKRIDCVRIELTLPPAFPEKYREAISRAIDQCSVKRHLLDPPQIDVTIVPAPDESRSPRGTDSILEAMSSFPFP